MISIWLFLCNLIFCVLQVTGKTWSEASEDKCKFTINHEDDVKFSQNPLLFINKLKTVDLQACRRVCCNHESCNGYVWDGLDPVENCKLLKCSNEGTDCKRALSGITDNVDKSNHEVGFITGVSDSGQQQGTLQQVSSSVPFTTTTTTVKPSILSPTKLSHTVNKLNALLESVNTPSQASSATKKAQTNKNGTNTISNFLQQQETPDAIGSKDLRDTVNTTTSTSTSKPTTTKKRLSHSTAKLPSTINPSRRPMQRIKGVINVDNSKTHSDSISLTAALFFGLVFMITTLYLVGKRWVESIKDSQKRGYTRISYLLNGV